MHERVSESASRNQPTVATQPIAVREHAAHLRFRSADRVLGFSACDRTSGALIISSESVLAQLRAATGDLHRELDGALGFGDGGLSRERYVAFLQGSLVALEAIEPQLQAFGDRAMPSRCQRLREDLRSLESPTSVGAPAEIPDICSEAAAFGARYVVEGSTLGGAVLARSFDAALQLQGTSLRYLTLYGARLGEHWREFCEELERFGRTATPEMRSEACACARAVFKLYGAAFRSTGAIAVRS
ncbi:MAG TPA: biliverdin-producing heme oxygenase [Polyangiaceae bacterium]|nr:biliverdin-producing heme oxygenase [Polyangiaceae bacterium]